MDRSANPANLQAGDPVQIPVSIPTPIDRVYEAQIMARHMAEMAWKATTNNPTAATSYALASIALSLAFPKEAQR